MFDTPFCLSTIFEYLINGQKMKNVRSTINRSTMPIKIYQIFERFVFFLMEENIFSICKLVVNVIYVNLFGERIILIGFFYV